jgi:hypothetical protein
MRLGGVSQERRGVGGKRFFSTPAAEVRVEGIIANPKAKLLEQVREIMRLRHYAIRTEEAYCDWIKRYIRFHGMRSRDELVPGTAKVEMFLSDLAVNGKVAASTQNQAFNALLFLYREVLRQPFGNVQAVRASRPVRVLCLPPLPYPLSSEAEERGMKTVPRYPGWRSPEPGLPSLACPGLIAETLSGFVVGAVSCSVGVCVWFVAMRAKPDNRKARSHVNAPPRHVIFSTSGFVNASASARPTARVSALRNRGMTLPWVKMALVPSAV